MAKKYTFLTDAQWDRIGRRLAAGESAPDIAREHGIAHSAVYRRFGGVIRPHRHIWKMTDAQAIEAKAMLLAGDSLRVVAECYGMTAQGIQHRFRKDAAVVRVLQSRSTRRG